MWNYRITYRPSDIEQGYSIREVVYNDNGDPVSYTSKEISPYGESKDELISDLAYMIQAISQDIVDLDALDIIFDDKHEYIVLNFMSINDNNYPKIHILPWT